MKRVLVVLLILLAFPAVVQAQSVDVWQCQQDALAAGLTMPEAIQSCPTATPFEGQLDCRPPGMTPAPISVPISAPMSSNSKKMLIRYSHYWPPLGGTNCSAFYNGYCHSRCASGERWEDWVNRGVACPPEWTFGTKVWLGSKEWTCVDRGGAIKYRDGIPWVDFLVQRAAHPFGSIVKVTITW